MDTKSFLQRVVATTDNIVICALKPGPTRSEDIFWNAGNCNTLQDAVDKIAEIDKDPNLTAYFAVGTHANNEETKSNGKKKILRRQSTATWFKALALDLDIGLDKGTPYATQKEGMQAMITALKAFGFPAPLVVNSGKGIHCYWPLDNEIARDVWVELSIALRYALREHGVVIDESKIHDASMVLRPAGSHHKKAVPWVEVAVVADCPNYNEPLLRSCLTKWIGMAAPASKRASANVSKKKLSSLSASILNGGYEPLNLAVIAKECQQIAALLKSRGATDMMGNPVLEPMWFAELGVAAYTTDPHQAMLDLCDGHPKFNLQDNIAKLAHWQGSGVTLCSTFDKLCAGGCNGCPHKGKINSVSALNRIEVFHINKLANDPEGENDTSSDEATVLPLPPGYYASNNCIWTDIEVEKVVKDDEGKKTTITAKEKQLISRYPIVVLDSYRSQCFQKSTLLWAAKFPITGWMSFEAPQDVISQGGAEFAKYMGNKQIYIHEQAILERTKKFMLDYSTFHQQHRPTGVDMQSFGWQADGSFLAGEKLIQPGMTKSGSWRPVKTLKTLQNRVKAVGDRDTWAGMTSILNEPCAHHIAFSTLIAASGFLLPATGIQSFVYSLWSPETGTGKTLALMFGNTIYGHPTENLLTPNDTNNALFQVMGSLGSYSAAMDEVTNMGNERAAEFAFIAQSGREKHSLTQGRELREGTQWHAPLRVSTNTSLFYMYDQYKTKNDAEKVRTLEVQVDSKEFIDKHGMRAIEMLVHDLSHNYGHAAHEIAEEIIHLGGYRKVYEKARDAFATRFPHAAFVGDERFYRAGIVCAWAVGKIGESKGLFQFDVDACTDWILERVGQLRTIRVNGRTDSFDTIGQFLSELNDKLVVVKETHGGKPVVQLPVPDVAVARIELIYDSKNQLTHGSKLMINTSRLKEWGKKTRDDINNLTMALRAAGAVISDKERVTIYKGTQHSNPGQANCLVLNLMHQRFADVLNSAKAVLPTNPSLALVQGGKP